MRTNEPSAGVARRVFFVGTAVVSVGALLWLGSGPPVDPMAPVAPLVKVDDRWSANDFYSFLKALPARAMLDLKKSVGRIKTTAKNGDLLGAEADARDMQRYALWVSSSVWEYPFKDEASLDYHGLVQWVAKEAGIGLATIHSASSFMLEYELQRLLFAEMWDKLRPDQRLELIGKIDPTKANVDRLALASLGGAAALAALSTTVAFTGFAFYTGMSMTIAAVASSLGITVPFAAYAGASTLVGALSGPIGWAFMCAAALGGLALSGRPNLQKTTALIGHMHALKVEALVAAGIPQQDVFRASVSPRGV